MNPSQETTAQDSERRKLIVDFNRLVVVASLLVVAFAAYLDLDYIFPSVLGSVVSGLNLHWTIRFVNALLIEHRASALVIIFHLLKFGISAAVIYFALSILHLSALGLLLGLSNIVLAVFFFTFRRVYRIQQSRKFNSMTEN